MQKVLRTLLLSAGVIFVDTAAEAAFYSAPKEFTFPDDNFAIVSHADPQVLEQRSPPGRVYQFTSPAFGPGILFTVSVSTTESKPGLTDHDWFCFIARNGHDMVSVTQSGLSGMQLVDDETAPNTVVAERVFIKDKKIYVITSWGEDPNNPSQYAGRAEMAQEFLSSWRLLDRPKDSSMPKVGGALSCATK